ncbi:hypothetical protein ACWDNU_46900, partial [Amycolatopsis sp. NPDC003676]
LLGGGLALAKAAKSAITGGSPATGTGGAAGVSPAAPSGPDSGAAAAGARQDRPQDATPGTGTERAGTPSGPPPVGPTPPARTDGPNNSRAILLLAAAVAAFTVMLVVLVVTRDRGADPTQQALDPVTVTTVVDGKVSTVVIVPEQETVTVSAPPGPAQTGPTTPGATSAPSGTSTSGKPTVTPSPTSTTITTTPFGPPSPDRIGQFIAGYYGMLPGNIGGAWAQLAPGYQAQTGGYGQYSSFWSTVRSVTVGSITPNGENRAVVSLTYHLTNGTVTSENRWIQVSGTGNSLQIAGSGV